MGTRLPERAVAVRAAAALESATDFRLLLVLRCRRLSIHYAAPTQARP